MLLNVGSAPGAWRVDGLKAMEKEEELQRHVPCLSTKMFVSSSPKVP